MFFTPTPLPGAYLVDLVKHVDERGFFARAWCEREFDANGLTSRVAQANLSYNRCAGTLRGLHYQLPPYGEAKLVRCTRGAIWDVMLDLRPDSAARGQWFAAELNADNHRMLYVPEGVAHGFITLQDDVEVAYQVSQCYIPQAERGVRWNDPEFSIQWPLVPHVISAKDAGWPDYQWPEPAA